jgi:hypothetical protein
MAYNKTNWTSTTPINTSNLNKIENGIAELYNAIFPVGQIVIKGDNEDYSNWLGFTWERTAVGKVLVGIDGTDTDFNTIGKTGGEKKHTLLQKEMPKEIGQALIYDSGTTEQSSSTDALTTQWTNKFRSGLYNVVNENGGNAHNNVQPYQVVAFWKRVA